MNKNTRRLRKAVARASHKGQTDVEYQTPVKDYHNDKKPRFLTKRCPTATANKEGVISGNSRRNMQMVVLRNKGEDGTGFSVTRHVPITDKRPVVFKNHGQYKDFGGSYKQPVAFK